MNNICLNKVALYCLVTITFITHNTTYCQNKSYNTYVSFSIGPAFPLSVLNSKDVQKDIAGFAITGFNTNLSLDFQPLKNIGFSLLIKQATYPVKTKALAAKYAYLNPGSSFTIEADDWDIGGEFVGVYGIVPLGDSSKIALTFRGYIGLMSGSTPAYLIKEEKNTGSQIWTEQAMGGTEGNFGYVLGGDLRFRIKPRLDFVINADYLFSEQSFNHIAYSNSAGQSGFTACDMKYTSINATLGIIYRINKK